jgi:hypothetical protein
MTKENQEELIAIAPEWFDRGDPRKSLMCFGFDVGNGWFDLLQQLLKHIKWMGPDENFRVVQVKEKFGSLRFYTSGATKEINAVIHFAEDLSYRICEDCGGKGKVGGKGWISVLCDPCREADQRRRLLLEAGQAEKA